MNKYEQLIEYIINDNETKARELFHEIVVETSRHIYENLVQDEDHLEDMGDDIDSDEEGLSGDVMDMDDEDMEDMGDEDMEDMGDEESESDVEELEDRVMELEAALDELTADFNELKAEEAKEPHHAGMFDDEEDMEDEDMGDEEDMGMLRESSEDMDTSWSDDNYLDEIQPKITKAYFKKDPAGKNAIKEKIRASVMKAVAADGEKFNATAFNWAFNQAVSFAKEDLEESINMSVMREYVEKIGEPYRGEYAAGEGRMVGAGGGGDRTSVNTRGVVAGKNDMGGTTSNIARGGAEQNPDGTSPRNPSNYGTKGQGHLPGAGQYENRPGARTRGYVNRQSARKAED